MRFLKKPIALKPDVAQAKFADAIDKAPGEKYRGKRAYKIITVQLERGKTYQIEMVSQVYYAFLYLEDSDGELVAENNSGGKGKTARIIHRATQTGAYRLIATSQDGVKAGDFSWSLRVLHRSGVLPKGLPSWFKDFDTDGDGQIALHEWCAAGKQLAEFRNYDFDDDGFITPDEVLRFLKNPIELAPTIGRANLKDAIDDPNGERYRGKKAYKILTIHFEQGKTYQIELTSKVFQSHLYLEDAEGYLLQEHTSAKVGGESHIIHRAAKTGTYRIIATSQGGFRTGDFTLSVRVKE